MILCKLLLIEGGTRWTGSALVISQAKIVNEFLMNLEQPPLIGDWVEVSEDLTLEVVRRVVQVQDSSQSGVVYHCKKANSYRTLG